MSKLKKFLDQEGVGILWEKIDEKFADAESVGTIIQAIDETIEELEAIPIHKGNGNNALAGNSADNQASANESSAFGVNTQASGDQSFAEGRLSKAVSRQAHAEGDSTIAGNQNIDFSEASDISAYEVGAAAHAEGIYTNAKGAAAHSEGFKTQAIGYMSHAEGENTLVQGKAGHVEGGSCIVRGDWSHAEGCNNGDTAVTADGIGSHAEGRGTNTTQNSSGAHAEGVGTASGAEGSHSEGIYTQAMGNASHAEGKFTRALGEGSHAEGYCLRGIYLEIVEGQEGYRLLDQNKSKLPNWLNGYYWEAGIESAIELGGVPLYGFGLYDVENKELLKATITKTYTVQNGDTFDLYAILDTDLNDEIIANPDRGYYVYYGKATGNGSHAEGGGIALGNFSHAEGSMTWAAHQSHAEGHMSASMNTGSHAEGIKNIARGMTSHAEGNLTQAHGRASHTEGLQTKAMSDNQHVQGKYNIEDAEGKYAHIVGNGTSNDDRSNAHTVDWDGNAEYAGDVIANGCGGENPISLKELSEAVENMRTESGQISDWNQNDETANDYIKNRTHYEYEGIVEETIAEYTDVIFSTSMGTATYNLRDTLSLADSGHYLLKINNTDMELKLGTYGWGYTFSDSDNEIGSNVIVDRGHIGVMNYSSELIENPAYIKISSIKNGIVTKQLDEKFIPESIARTEDIIGRKGVGIRAEEFNNSINVASGEDSHAEGEGTTASGTASHAEGGGTQATGGWSHAEGCNAAGSDQKTTASGVGSHAEGRSTQATQEGAHSEGILTQAKAYASHAEGKETIAGNANTHTGAHAEGFKSQALSASAHAEGYNTRANGDASHSEGNGTFANGQNSHAEGENTIADALNSHAEGGSCKALSDYTHAEGEGTIARGRNQHVQGMYNVEDTGSKYAHIVGGGSSDTDRENIHTLDWNGNAVFAGDVKAYDTSAYSLVNIGNKVETLANKVNKPRYFELSNNYLYELSSVYRMSSGGDLIIGGLGNTIQMSDYTGSPLNSLAAATNLWESSGRNSCYSRSGGSWNSVSLIDGVTYVPYNGTISIAYKKGYSYDTFNEGILGLYTLENNTIYK